MRRYLRGSVFFVAGKELNYEHRHKNTGENRQRSCATRKIHNVLLAKDTERCKGCPYPGVGFICWSTDGSCMRTDGRDQQAKEVMTD